VLARVHSWLDRHPAGGDAGVALVVIAFSLTALVGQTSPGALGWIFTFALGAPLAVRRRWPIASFAAVMLLCGAELLLVDEFLAANVAALVSLYTLVGYAPRRIAAAGVAVALAGTVPFALHFDEFSQSGRVLAWVVMTVHLVLVSLLGDRMRAERERRDAVAASEERSRIARELHDVIAHSLSVVIAQADGGRYAAHADPSAATEALRTIAASAREAQAEMRRALGVLGTKEDAPLRPQPGVAELPTLVQRTRDAGLAVAYDERGASRPVAPATGMTVYRVAQEALTNVLKHAGPGAAASVELRWEPEAVTVVVRDDGAGARSRGDGRGRGLAGMRERVEPRGGTLRAGPRPDGGFEVHATIPERVPA
jgi:signal transduction histidine kinase